MADAKSAGTVDQLIDGITGSAARPGWDSCHLRPFNKDSMQDYSQLERFGVHYCHPTPSEPQFSGPSGKASATGQSVIEIDLRVETSAPIFSERWSMFGLQLVGVQIQEPTSGYRERLADSAQRNVGATGRSRSLAPHRRAFPSARPARPPSLERGDRLGGAAGPAGRTEVSFATSA